MLWWESVLRQRSRKSAERLLPTMTMPCLLYVGEVDSYYPGALECMKHIPNARFVSFPGLNRSQTSQASHLVVPQVMQFLQQVMQQEHAARR
jgi:hypothetical protein